MINEWLAHRLGMGHPAAMSQFVNRMQKDAATIQDPQQQFKIPDKM